MIKRLSVLLTVMLLAAALSTVSLAANEPERETVTVPDYYEALNEYEHTVTATLWSYPIVNGERSSGKPLGDVEFPEAHAFTEGVCPYCDEVCADPEAILTNACGIGLLKGTPAASTLRAFLFALPDDAGLTFPGMDDDAVARLTEALNGGAGYEEVLDLLAGFPRQSLDDVECLVVTAEYADFDGQPVGEQYAFSAADGALVDILR